MKQYNSGLFSALLLLVVGCASPQEGPVAAAPLESPGMHGFGIVLPLPLIDLNGDGTVSSPSIGSLDYEVDVEESGLVLQSESFLSEERDLSLLVSLGFADYELSGPGGSADADATVLGVGVRKYFPQESSSVRPFIGSSLSYSPELDVEGFDYGSFAYLTLGGGVDFPVATNFDFQLGLDYLFTIVDPEYSEVVDFGFGPETATDELSVDGFRFWIAGMFYF